MVQGPCRLPVLRDRSRQLGLQVRARRARPPGRARPGSGPAHRRQPAGDGRPLHPLLCRGPSTPGERTGRGVAVRHRHRPSATGADAGAGRRLTRARTAGFEPLGDALGRRASRRGPGQSARRVGQGPAHRRASQSLSGSPDRHRSGGRARPDPCGKRERARLRPQLHLRRVAGRPAPAPDPLA